MPEEREMSEKDKETRRRRQKKSEEEEERRSEKEEGRRRRKKSQCKIIHKNRQTNKQTNKQKHPYLENLLCWKWPLIPVTLWLCPSKQTSCWVNTVPEQKVSVNEEERTHWVDLKSSTKSLKSRFPWLPDYITDDGHPVRVGPRCTN